MRSAAHVVSHSDRLRVLLCDCVRASGVLVGAARGYNLKVGAGRVILVLAAREVAVHVGSRGPLPDPVHGQLARLRVLRDLKVGFAPGFHGGIRLIGDVVGLEHLSLFRDAAAVELMASTVIKVLGSHQETALISTAAVGGPFHDVGDLLAGKIGLGCTEHEDRSAARRLAGDVPGECDMPVLEVLHGDVVTGRDLKHRVVCRVVVGSLCWMAQQIAGVQANSGATVGCSCVERWKHPLIAEAVISRCRSRHVASCEATVADI